MAKKKENLVPFPKVECYIERVSFIIIYAKRLPHPRAEFWPPKKNGNGKVGNSNLNCIEYPFRILTNIALVLVNYHAKIQIFFLSTWKGMIILFILEL